MAFDMSGQSTYRTMWERYYEDCQGIVFVVDASDTMRMAVAKNELQLLVQHPLIRNKDDDSGGSGGSDRATIPILILANKSDLTTALPTAQVGIYTYILWGLVI